MRVGWAIGLRPEAGQLQQLALITMFAFHAVLAELERPSAPGGPDAPYMGL